MFKGCLHIPFPFPCPCPFPSKFIIMSIKTDDLMERMGSNLSIRQSVNILKMVNFDSDEHGHGKGNGLCKQALKLPLEIFIAVRSFLLPLLNFAHLILESRLMAKLSL